MNNGTLRVFDDLVRCVIDGVATEEEIQDLADMMRHDSELQARYCRQMYVHALLSCHTGQEWVEDGRLGRTVFPSRVKKTVRIGCKVAAAVALLLGGAAAWCGVENAGLTFGLAKNRTSGLGVSAVRLVNQKSVSGLNLPAALPGVLRLESGEVVVRLQTGVELTVLGPASLEIHNGMRVRLDYGNVLANVPHWATGFAVRTKEIEVCDLGTLFSVKAYENGSDVFVFKGSVQVNEARCEWGRETTGADIGVCGAGDGVRAVKGEPPVKISVENPEARKLFECVRGTLALVNAGVALDTAARIAELGTTGKVSRSESARKKADWVRMSSFRKTAGTRLAGAIRPSESRGRTLMDVLSEPVAKTVSDPVQVESSPCGDNRRWSTVFTNEVALTWDWVVSASNARLEIAGMNATFVTNFTAETSEYVWRPFASSVPSVEDLYNLSLTFYGDDETVVGLLTARLVVMTGAFGKTVVDLRPVSEGLVFQKRNMIIPYDASWVATTSNVSGSLLSIATPKKMTQTNRFAETSGYYGCKLDDFGAGTFELGLTFLGTTEEWSSKVSWTLGGMVMGIR